MSEELKWYHYLLLPIGLALIFLFYAVGEFFSWITNDYLDRLEASRVYEGCHEQLEAERRRKRLET